MMNCSVHQQKEASGSCVYCGKFFCEDCLIEVDNKYYCKEHVKLLIQHNKAHQSEMADSFEDRDWHRSNMGDNRYSNHPHNQPNIYINNSNMNQHYPNFYYYNYKSRMVALLLCIFLGFGGFHRFYVGKIGTGLIWLFTGGVFGIGWFIDIILLALGLFRDVNGQLLD